MINSKNEKFTEISRVFSIFNKKINFGNNSKNFVKVQFSNILYRSRTLKSKIVLQNTAIREEFFVERAIPCDCAVTG